MLSVLASDATTAVESSTAVNEQLGVGATPLLRLSTVVMTGDADVDEIASKEDVIDTERTCVLDAIDSASTLDRARRRSRDIRHRLH